MKGKGKNVVCAVLMAAGMMVVFTSLEGVAGNLEPDGPPASTMVTLDELSQQIQALSSPVNTVVSGAVTFNRDVTVMSAGLARPVDPNKSVVLLSDAVSTELRTVDYPEWLGRTGTVLVELTAGEITIRVEPLSAVQQVSYQVVEYK